MHSILKQLKESQLHSELELGSTSGAPHRDANEGDELIRNTIREQVESILWLDHLKEEDAEYQRRVAANSSVKERCLVCTLPWGTCVHTKEWMREKQQQREDQQFREQTNLDQQINDLLSVLDDTGVRYRCFGGDLAPH